jgi:methylated-DNA-[protein]-cysteine S-methyltransferase
VPRTTQPDRFDAVVPSPVGPLGIAVVDDRVRRIAFLPPRRAPRPPAGALAREVAAQLARYFADPSTPFDLPLDEGGTPFQHRVWAALRALPTGTTASYGDLATRLASGPRAVGGACRANPLVIVTPCHRIVAAGGALGGFAGATDGRPLATKRWLLDHEVHAR